MRTARLRTASVVVVAIVAAFVASVAGLQTGDVVVAIDGRPVAGEEDAEARAAGPSGSVVRLTVQRGGAQVVVQVIRA